MTEILFELHLTSMDLAHEQLASFEEACVSCGGKSLVIELGGREIARQPMAAIVKKLAGSNDAIEAAHAYAGRFNELGFPVHRIKIEVPAENAQQVTVSTDGDFKPYYEWHGKVSYQQPEILSGICAAHSAHLSANALSTDKTTRFITVREFGSYDVFAQRVQQLTTALLPQWPVLKQQFEYCIYDNKISLDKEWMEH